jgi:hypothetical protein
MPLTDFQKKIAKLLSVNRTEDSHLAGGAALHAKPGSLRYSEDLDYFHDSEKRVIAAFDQDRSLLEKNNYVCRIDMSQRGYIRCIVEQKKQATKVEWAQDTSWRFMPVQQDPDLGYVLHPMDLVINKMLALVGRDEARDYLDVIDSDEKILPLGAQIWAACGKDPGYSPNGILEMLKRRGKYRDEDFKRLHLLQPVDLHKLKSTWILAIENAEAFVQERPFEEIGCLYFSKLQNKFFQPSKSTLMSELQIHRGKPGGVLPMILENETV